MSRKLAVDSPFANRLDARIKIIGALAAIVVCVSTPAAAFGAFGCYAAVLLLTIFLSRLSWRHIARRALVIVPFAIMVAAFAPFLHAGQTGGGISLGLGACSASPPALVVWNVVIKALFSVTVIVVLTGTTPFPEMLNGLRGLWVPEILVMLLSFTYRYLFVLGDELRRLRRAHAARGFRGRWLWQAASLGRLIGALFLRTYERAERVYVAMVSRGFTGHFPHLPRLAWRVRDLAALAVFCAPLLVARWILA